MPEPVSFIPRGPRQLGCAIDVMPVWRIIPLEFGHPPRDSHGAKHREISPGVRTIGIEKCSVPIKKDSARSKSRSFHKDEIVAEFRSSRLLGAVAMRERVVAFERDVVEHGSVTFPTRRLRFLDAHDMSRSPHADAALAQRAAQEAHFHFDGSAALHLAGCEKEDAA